ncbi:hypothetical protein Asi02nite_80110 [Asanoa siamensis]|uniref:Uncharacterized protein n=1 Tax=Asanoa siamensis TaxID=926357 RepID=A0ABQ4D4M5_9ACTN|nr:hypothetical protein Asi02nite_80110 [Asanoa siamensis]
MARRPRRKQLATEAGAYQRHGEAANELYLIATPLRLLRASGDKPGRIPFSACYPRCWAAAPRQLNRFGVSDWPGRPIEFDPERPYVASLSPVGGRALRTGS